MKGLVYKYKPLSKKIGEGISDIDKIMDILENNRLYFPKNFLIIFLCKGEVNTSQ